MTGCWEGTLPSGATYEEMWMAPRVGMRLGTARIEGERDGQLRGMDFPLRRVGCEPSGETTSADIPHLDPPPEVEPYRDQVAVFMTATPAALEALRARMPEDDFHVVAGVECPPGSPFPVTSTKRLRRTLNPPEPRLRRVPHDA